MNVGLIGYGTIGQTLADAIRSGQAGDARLVAVLDVFEEPPFDDEDGGPLYTTDIDRFLATDISLVVEAASQTVLKKYAGRALAAGKDLLPLSVGAFVDEALLEEVRALARRHERHVFLPSGAIGGLDAIAAAAIDEIDEVVLTTTKPPAGLQDLPFTPPVDLATLSEPACIYEGPAAEAVRLFPKNVNVAALLSLAGIGFDRTRVRIVADPVAKQNRHHIAARGSFGQMTLEFRLFPSPTNPKTSYLAALSAIRTLKSLTEPIRI